jgi:hypothetical protein
MEQNCQLNNNVNQEVIFIWIFFLFIFSWISVELVGRALNNFTFETLKLDPKSTFHTTIIALVVVAIELLTIYYFRSFGIFIYDPIILDSNNYAIKNENITINGILEGIDKNDRIVQI